MRYLGLLGFFTVPIFTTLALGVTGFFLLAAFASSPLASWWNKVPGDCPRRVAADADGSWSG